MNRLNELLADHEMYHSRLQQDYFITARDYSTPYGCYKQSLREVHSRVASLKATYFEIEKLKIDIMETESLLSTPQQSNFRTMRLELDLKQKNSKLHDCLEQFNGQAQEFMRFYQQADYLKQQIGELSPERKDQLDREMWEARIKEIAAYDYITTGKLSKTVLELSFCLPANMKVPLMKSLQNADELVAWLENKQSIEFPILPSAPQKLLEETLGIPLMIE